MSWEEYKKKRKQGDDTDTLIDDDITIEEISEDDSQMSSWEKYKKEKEENKNTESKEKITISQKEDVEKNTWFKKSESFDDGYQFGDVSKTALSSLGDAGLNAVKGIMGLGEGIGDTIQYGVADVIGLFGNEDKANKIRENVKYNAVDTVFEPTISKVDENSIFGDKSDSIAEGLGYVAGITAISMLSGGAGATLGVSSTTAATIGSTAATFTSAMGNGITEALNNGADLDEARIYGAISGAGESLSELMFGGLGKAAGAVGISKGIGELDDIIIGGLTKNVKNKMVKTVMQSGLKAGGEGLEEVVSGLISAAGKKLTYMDEKEYSEIVKDENLAEQFWMGALTSAIAQGPSTIKSVNSGTDYITGRTSNEQKVYDSLLETKTNELKVQTAINDTIENNKSVLEKVYGRKLTSEELNGIKETVNDTYNAGKMNTENVKLSNKQISEIKKSIDKDFEDGNISIETIRDILGENQDISKDAFLMRSMNENEQKYNSYKVEQTDNEKINILMQSAADAGMNNTTKTRKKVELISKLVQDTDRQYKFVSKEQLKEMGYNENANGLINKSTGEILINAHSEKGLQAIVGHETTHIFDSKDKKGNYSKEYQSLQDAAIEYAKAKGIYESKVQNITNTYGDLLADETQIKEELTADLVGDFLFNDEKFIENLAVKDRNVFQKIYDYIKHIYKVATSGTEEAKALENLKYQFDKVYKTVSAETNSDIKYSIAGKKSLKSMTNEQLRKAGEESYKEAKKMLKQGKNNKEIFEKTGWFKDKVTGKMKYNFSDKNMELIEHDYKVGQEYTLVEILKHKTLFEIYPQLRNYKVKIENLSDNKINGRFNALTNELQLDINRLKDKTNAEGTLIHEIQHAIQKIEGFANGTSTKFGKENYTKSPGEIEAKDTSTRMRIEKIYGKDLSNILPKSANIDVNPIEKMKIGLYNYITNIINEEIVDENTEINQEKAESNQAKDNRYVLDSINNGGNANYEENFEIDNYFEEQANEEEIQNIEGFSHGTSTKKGLIQYYNNLGEIEASDTKERMIQEKNGIKLSEPPESSKKHPTHAALKGMNAFDKARFYIYNSIRDMSKKGGKNINESFESNEEKLGENSRQISNMVVGRERIEIPQEYKTLDGEDLNNETIKTNKKETLSSISENNGLVLGRVIHEDRVNGTNNAMEESENNSGSFSFDPNVKRYDDLQEANTVKFNKRTDGTINIEISNNDELINQFTVTSKENASRQLGNDIANYIYNNASENSKSLNLQQSQIVESTDTSHKGKQLNIIKKTNPMLDDYHTGIRNIDDIKTFDEVINDEDSFAWGDFSLNDARKALDSGKITVYSSYPIKQGTFVSTSKIQAEEYAGGSGNKVYSKTIPLEDVAWINGDEGQYANIKQKYSLTNDIGITGDDVAVKDLQKQEKATIEDAIGSTVIKKPTVEEVITQTEEQKQQGMKDKAKKYLSRSKTKFINKIVDDFGTSKIANTKTLNSVVDKIREDIQQNGTLSKEKADKYFDELYNNLVKIDTLYYDTYKEVKDNIRNTKLYISDKIREDMSDYDNFRKSNRGTLLMTNDKSNMPIDSYYQELSELYPELFPNDIIKPAEQLEKISEVAKDITKVETNVAAYNDKYMGPDYRSWARASFDKNINDFTQDIKLADRYNMANNETIKIGVDKDIVKHAYKQLPNAKKVYEKAISKELLTKEDRLQVDRLLNNEISLQDIPNGLNKKGIIKVAESKLEYDSLQKVIKEYQKDIKSKRIEEAKNDVGNLDLWKDKNIGFKYSRETPIRNIYDIAPKEIADKIVNKYFRSYIEVNEKKVVDAINGYNDRIKKLDIGTKNKYEIRYMEAQQDKGNIKREIVTKKVSESALVQLLGENKITVDDIQESGADIGKIQNAVNEFRTIYNELIEQINESMLDNGYAPVEYRKDYFPHFTEEKVDTLLGKAAKLLGIDITNREELPTDIAGQTYQFKPGRTWFGNILQRTIDVTDYDVLKGFDKYIRGATDLIYHTGDIQNLRALSTAIRGTYNDVEIQNKIEEIKESTMSDLDKSTAIQEVYNAAKDKSHLSKFIEWLDNYTNILAGKKAINDRGTEKELNRQMYKTMQDIESRIAANAIGGNIGVSLTNFAPLSQAWGELKTTNLINGVWQTMKAALGKDTSFSSESQFVTRRRGTDTLSETTLDKITKPLNNVLQFADDFTSEVIVKSRYNQNLQEGMSPELALEEADRYAAGLMGDRGRGALPTQFSNKNPISKMINMFQVEVNNQWSYYLKDLPKNIQEKANNNKAKVIANTATAYTKIMVGAYLTNELLGSIRGQSTRVLPDPIYIIAELIKGLTDDDDENDDDAVIQTLTEVAGNVPFIALPATLVADSLGLEVGDIGRISISGAIPNISDITADIFDVVNGKKTVEEGIKSVGGELLDTVGASLILPYGGSQIKKTAKGLSMYLNDIPGSYTDNGDLRYTVENDVGSKVQAAIFGAYANPYAQDYIDSGFKSIKKENIEEMVGLDMNSSEYRQFKSDLSEISDTSDKNGYKQYVDANSNTYWYDSDSEIMYDSNYNKTSLTKDDLTKVSKIEESLNYIDSLDLTDVQKNIAANNLNKNSKKKIAMSEYGNYSSYDEYKYARDYPQKYSVVSQITDYDSYVKYKDEISDIKEQYSTELGYESKERKAAVQSYINSLDLDVYQKMMLEKMAGGYSIKNYKNSIYEYLETTNLTQSEKYTIWEELFE